MKITLQPAQLKDASLLLALQRKAYVAEAEINHDPNIPPLTQSLEELENEFEQKKIFKVEHEGNIIATGQTHFQDGTCYIGRMAVEPSLQGQGIGSQLLAALENTFPNTTRLELFTGSKSVANLGMYQHRGYTPFKKVEAGATTLIFLEKRIS